ARARRRERSGSKLRLTTSSDLGRYNFSSNPDLGQLRSQIQALLNLESHHATLNHELHVEERDPDPSSDQPRAPIWAGYNFSSNPDLARLRSQI
ncbi:hypothetical protein FCV25MIE_15784, partial [Fagus crenata]